MHRLAAAVAALHQRKRPLQHGSRGAVWKGRRLLVVWVRVRVRHVLVLLCGGDGVRVCVFGRERLGRDIRVGGVLVRVLGVLDVLVWMLVVLRVGRGLCCLCRVLWQTTPASYTSAARIPLRLDLCRVLIIVRYRLSSDV